MSNRALPPDFLGGGFLKKVALAVLFFCLAAGLPAAGLKEKDNVIQVAGRVRLVGSATFPELVITGRNMDWYIDKDEAHKLKEFQQLNVIVEGSETVMELRFANGRSAGERRTLKNITIIEVEKPFFAADPVGESAEESAGEFTDDTQEQDEPAP